MKDHLGNIRLWVSDLGNDGIIETSSEILQEKHYYPFGMEMEGPWMQSGANNPYQYNGKELVSDFGLNLLDYGARWYDAGAARWWSVDPLGEEMSAWSPYNYVFDNPIKLTDPDGKSPDNLYRNEAGDLVAVERNNNQNDNFYTIDNNGDVTLDVSRNNQVDGFNRLTDVEKNQVVNYVDEVNSSTIRIEDKVNQNGLTEEQSNNIITTPVTGAVVTRSATLGTPLARGTITPRTAIGAFQTREGNDNVKIVTAGDPINPGGFSGVVPTGTLPTPVRGTSVAIAPNSLPRNQTITKEGFNGNMRVISLTDNNGNIVPTN
ncbi:MAG: RHS repeat-associated core domain-containing protein [Chitinophagales bacterium]